VSKENEKREDPPKVELTNCTGFVPKENEKGEDSTKMELTNCTGFVPKQVEKDKKERSMINLFEHKKTETNENVLNAVEGDGWEFMSVLIDSGSTETVTSSDTLAGYEMVSTDWSESGKGYSAANGTDIPNLGEKVVQGQAANGMWCTMRFQICNVTKPLGSVSRICQAGSRVVFGPPEEGSYIEHVTTRKKTWLRQCKGLYYLDMWIAPATVFTRPGKM